MDNPQIRLCAKEDNFFQILQDFTLKLGTLFQFATRDQCVSEVKYTLARDMIVQKHYLESTYSSVVINSILAIALLKNLIYTGMLLL